MQLFADIRTPMINEATLKRIMSSRVKENIFQQIFTRPNEAVTEKYSTDTTASEIQVLRIKPVEDYARELGSDKNGGWFNSEEASYSTTEAYGIKIIDEIDRNIDIPTVQQDMMNVELAEAELSNLAGKVNRAVNGMTIAAQLAKNFNDVATGLIAKNWVELDATPDYLSAIIDAGTKLDEGNSAESIDAYPDEMRAIIVRPEAKNALLKKGQVIIGGSDSAQKILRKGGLDTDTTPEVASTAYVGEVNNMPVYVAAPAVFNLAAKYMGVRADAINGVKAMVVSAIGTGRALAFNAAIKIIDAPGGQGRRLQPKYRMGAQCWDGLSVVPIVANGFTNPASSTSLLTVKAPGSRVLTAVVTATPGTSNFDTSVSVTLACATPNAKIYYTTDGTTPTTSSTLYSAAISLTATKTVKAFAVVDGGVPSDVQTFVYTKN